MSRKRWEYRKSASYDFYRSCYCYCDENNNIDSWRHCFYRRRVTCLRRQLTSSCLYFQLYEVIVYGVRFSCRRFQHVDVTSVHYDVMANHRSKECDGRVFGGVLSSSVYRKRYRCCIYYFHSYLWSVDFPTAFHSEISTLFEYIWYLLNSYVERTTWVCSMQMCEQTRTFLISFSFLSIIYFLCCLLNAKYR